MIRDRIVNYLARITDYPLLGRNRSRIVIGTDRKNTRESGFGDGGQNDVESSCVDIVAGFSPDSGDPDMINDKSRIYVCEKTNPDEYFDIQVGESVSEEPANIIISDHIRIKGRKTIKLMNSNFSIVVSENGDVAIKSAAKIVVDSSDIKLGASDATEVPAFASKVLEELQRIATVTQTFIPGTGGAALTPYIAPSAVGEIGATKTKVS